MNKWKIRSKTETSKYFGAVRPSNHFTATKILPEVSCGEMFETKFVLIQTFVLQNWSLYIYWAFFINVNWKKCIIIFTDYILYRNCICGSTVWVWKNIRFPAEMRHRIGTVNCVAPSETHSKCEQCSRIITRIVIYLLAFERMVLYLFRYIRHSWCSKLFLYICVHASGCRRLISENDLKPRCENLSSSKFLNMYHVCGIFRQADDYYGIILRQISIEWVLRPISILFQCPNKYHCKYGLNKRPYYSFWKVVEYLLVHEFRKSNIKKHLYTCIEVANPLLWWKLRKWL